MDITVNEAINRGRNFLGIVLLNIYALTLVSVVLIETEWNDRIDDILIITLAIIGIFWYRFGKNRFIFSLVPLILNALALATHIISILIELDDAKAIGDDILAVQYFLFTTIFLAWIWYRGRKHAQRQEGENQ